jgi:DNA mismatch repair protein MutS
LDEVGRGTSTYDGVAIAWSVVEYLHNKIGAKTLFATHYHELVDMGKYLKRVKNYNIAVKEKNGKITFLRKIRSGGTDKSYGVHVAEFAGIPSEVIKKSYEILSCLESEGIFEVNNDMKDKETKKTHPQMPLLLQTKDHPVIDELKDIDTDNLTPIEALKKLDKLINKVNR